VDIKSPVNDRSYHADSKDTPVYDLDPSRRFGFSRESLEADMDDFVKSIKYRADGCMSEERS
jgi:hypothetical protein